MRILGFDVSSTTLAFALFECTEAGGSPKLLECSYIKPIKKGTIIDRLASTRDQVRAIIERLKPDHIAIENIIEYMPGRSTARTVITLAVFNRMVGLLAYDFLGRSPELINVLAIRNAMKKMAGLIKVPQKEDLPALLEKCVLTKKWEWEINRNGKPKPTNFDRSDAIAVAYTAIMKMREQANKKIKKVAKKRR
jgi:Holliday junction resolvasome RuvABC endonuclease subunit